MDLQKLCAFMRQTAIDCGNIMLQAEGERVAVTEKTGFRDLVTRYDAAVQKATMDKLAAEYPQASFFCEEGEERTLLSEGLTFVIDPIDGTTNFARGLRHSCISAAALIDGMPSVGVIYNPFSGECMSAVKGGGTECNGRKVTVAAENLENSLVLFGTSPYRADLYQATLDSVRAIYGNCLDLRRSGSAALDLCDTAAGRVGLFFEHSLSLWDYAAGVLLVEEAGGKCVTLSGGPVLFNGEKSSIIAGPAANIEQALQLFGTIG